jgi:hypothetical protein
MTTAAGFHAGFRISRGTRPCAKSQHLLCANDCWKTYTFLVKASFQRKILARTKTTGIVTGRFLHTADRLPASSSQKRVASIARTSNSLSCTCTGTGTCMVLGESALLSPLRPDMLSLPLIYFRASTATQRGSSRDSSTFTEPGLDALHGPRADSMHGVNFSVRIFLCFHCIIACPARKPAQPSWKLCANWCRNFGPCGSVHFVPMEP